MEEEREGETVEELGVTDELGPTGRELAPSICDWTAGEKVPFIPVNSNFAEKAKAGYWGFLGSLRLTDSYRMKLKWENRVSLRPIKNDGGGGCTRTNPSSWVRW